MKDVPYLIYFVLGGIAGTLIHISIKLSAILRLLESRS